MSFSGDVELPTQDGDLITGHSDIDEAHLMQANYHMDLPDTFWALLRPTLAEFIASALFLFVSCGSAMTTLAMYQLEGPKVIGIALTFGFAITALAFTVGHISGGHLNCVVTLSLVVFRKISWKRGLMYFFAQFFGGMVGVGFLKATTPKNWWHGSCFAANMVDTEMTVGHAFLLEFILTFFLMMVVSAACDSNKSNQTMVPVAIGLCVSACHFMAIPMTGTSLNPTRSFASAAVASQVEGCARVWDDHWVFWLGPILGGLLAATIYEFVFHDGGSKFDNLVNQYRTKSK